MAQFFTDFSEYQTGFPSGWASVGDSAPWTVANNVNAIGGKALKVEVGFEFPSSQLRWTDIGTDQTLEVVARIQQNKISNGAGVILRGNAANREGYLGQLAEGKFRAMRISNLGSSTLLGTDADFAYLVNDWVWVRVRIEGTTFSGKAWKDGDDEPSSWSWQITDSIISSAGLVGFRVNITAFSSVTFYDVLGVGTDGDAAPTEPPSGGGETDVEIESPVLEGTADMPAPMVTIPQAATVGVSLTSIEVQAVAPVVSTATASLVGVPLSTVAVTGIVPDVVSVESITVGVPLTPAMVTAVAPTVTSSRAVVTTVPLTQVTVSAPPASVGSEISAAVRPPRTDITVTALSPGVLVTRTLTVTAPLSTVSIEALPGTVSTALGVVVSVPGTTVIFETFDPVVVTQGAATVPIPLTSMGVTVPVPQVSAERSALLAVPQTGVAVQTFAPQVTAEVRVTVSVPLNIIEVQSFPPVLFTVSEVLVTPPTVVVLVQSAAPAVLLDRKLPLKIILKVPTNRSRVSLSSSNRTTVEVVS